MNSSSGFTGGALKKRPRIGLNGRFLLATRTGVQRSAYRMFRSVVEAGPDMDFLLFTGESELFAPEWQLPNVKVIPTNLKAQAIFRNYFWEQFILPRLAKKYNVQILHNPANLAPIFTHCPSVVNIHDLCFMVEPTWFSLTFRLIYSFLVPIIVDRSKIVITNSNYSKNDILSLLDVSLNKIRLTYWAVDPLFYEPPPLNHPKKEQILFVGSLEPRKNLAGLLQAYSLFRRNNPCYKHKLVVVGCENSLFAEEQYSLGEFRQDIEFVGYVSDANLRLLYQESTMLVYPSFYEGFGFPPLEAMASGIPVITSNSSSLPEVVGDAAIKVTPSDYGEIALSMAKLCDPAVAAYHSEQGKKQASQFSWEQVGEHVVSIYREILAT
jgi:glycosyltransferase involved in cell wall biosynthesis